MQTKHICYRKFVLKSTIATSKTLLSPRFAENFHIELFGSESFDFASPAQSTTEFGSFARLQFWVFFAMQKSDTIRGEARHGGDNPKQSCAECARPCSGGWKNSSQAQNQLPGKARAPQALAADFSNLQKESI